MIDHPYTPHPVPGFTNRDQCEYRLKDEPGICAEPKSAHAVISDLKPRDLGCQCHQEEGDSPCKVHGEERLAIREPTPFKEPEGFCRHETSIPHPQNQYCTDWKRAPAPLTQTMRWPRKVGWTKLLARRKACKHVFTKGRVVASITFAADRCPRCLADEVAYWKGRTHSAEGQRDAMLGVAKTALAQVKAGFIDVVLDGPPDHEAGRFVEVEDPKGHSVKVGEWIDRGNGMWALRIDRPVVVLPAKAVAT